jgi:hypothetical protein
LLLEVGTHPRRLGDSVRKPILVVAVSIAVLISNAGIAADYPAADGARCLAVLGTDAGVDEYNASDPRRLTRDGENVES